MLVTSLDPKDKGKGREAPRIPKAIGSLSRLRGIEERRVRLR
jgi:hypothetical protein